MPPKFYPLPAKPVTTNNNNNIPNRQSQSQSQQVPQYQQAQQQQQQQQQPLTSSNQSNPLVLPRSTFYATPQPASPRPNPSNTLYSPYQGSSPRVPYGSSSGGGSVTPARDLKDGPIAAVEDISNRRKALKVEELRTNCDQIEFGLGWKVHWRSWTGHSILAGSFSSSTRTNEPPPSKRSKPDDKTTPHPHDSLPSPLASTSTVPSLSEQLQTLKSHSISSDPIEAARLEIVKIKLELVKSNLEFGQFECFVQVATDLTKNVQDEAQWKGKDKEVLDGEGGASRTLWIFSVEKGTGESKEEKDPILDALAGFEFPNLSTPTSGTFSYADLFDPNTPSPLTSQPASTFPSAASLSMRLESSTVPYQAFLASLNKSLLVSLLDGSPHKNYTAIPLDDSIIFLPPPSEAFGVSGRRTIAEAVKTYFKLSIQKNGVAVQSIVEDIALRSLPTGLSIPNDSPLLLAPLGIEATFVKVYPATTSTTKSKSKIDLAGNIESTWQAMLSGTGLSLPLNESWILCRLTFPNSTSTPTSLDTSTASSSPPDSAPVNHFLEVVWPSSLCLLNGTLPQPLRTPNSTPPRPKASELQDFDSEAFLSTRVSPIKPLDSAARRKLAEGMRRRGGRGMNSGLGERIIKRAEGVNDMMVEMEQEKERLEEKEREEKALALARSLAPPITSTALPLLPLNSLDQKGIMGGTSNLSMAGQPINIRTPISLGGSVTEGPSPADAFERGGNNYSSFLPATPITQHLQQHQEQQHPNLTPSTIQLVEADQLYPSPPGGGSTTGDLIMSTLDQQLPMMENNFATFDWGDDFAGGSGNGMSRSGLPQDFDDGMMMGLTDDDFSFFDDPAPPPTSSSLPPLPYGVGTGGLQSAGPSPKFVDHFSHLTGQTPFNSVVSPTSPFGHQHPSPHLTSPSMSGYAFDNTLHMNSNALGLGATPMNPMVESPFKTPKTPYSPFVELSDEITSPAYYSTASTYRQTSTSIAGTPHYSSSSGTRNIGKGSAFDAVNFGNSHSLSDEKYDPRKGKFGLPSPESDSAIDDESTSNLSIAVTKVPASGPWYSTVCDPRVTAAGQLQRRRRKSTIASSFHSKSISNSKSKSDLIGVRRWLRTETTDSEGLGGETESDDDAMEIDYESNQLELRRDSGFMFVTSSNGEEGMREGQALGVALLLLGKSVGNMTKNKEEGTKKKEVTGVVAAAAKVIQAADSALEATAALVADQITHNLAFRARATEFVLARRNPSSPTLVSAWALQHVHERLQKIPNINKAYESSTLSELTSPSIVLRAQQSIVQTNPSACRFWKPMAFEPLAGSKDVSAFVLFEEGGAGLQNAVTSWLKNVSNAYSGVRLGKHIPATTSLITQGLASVPLGSLSQARVKTDCQSVCTQIAETARTSKHVVVYLLTSPSLSPSSTSSLSLAVTQLLKSRSAASAFSILVYPIPLPTISDPRSISGDDSTTTRLNQLAFSVYDQLLVSIQKIRAPVPETFPSGGNAPSTGPFTRLFQAPFITISPSRRTVIKFELNWPPASLEVMHRHRILHVGYTTILAQNNDGLEWIILTFIDEKGEIWKTVPKAVRPPEGEAGQRFKIRTVWNIAKAVMETADVEWRIVICKLGLMRKSELRAWDLVLTDSVALSKKAFHVTLTCSDLTPPVSIILLPDETIRPSSLARRRSSAEEGELTVVTSTASLSSNIKAVPHHFDTQPTFAAFTLTSDLFTTDSSLNLVAPISTYIAYIPRFASLSHTSFQSTSVLSNSPSNSSNSISLMGLHLLGCHHTRSSTLDITLGEHIKDVRQNFIELATLGRLRWGTSGRIAWHLEAIGQVAELLGG